MSLQGSNQSASTGLRHDTTAEELMMWLAGFPGQAKISAMRHLNDYGQGDSYSLSASWDPNKVKDELDLTYTNLDQAEEIIQRIDVLKKVQAAVKNAFAHRELDGGAVAGMKHELYLCAQAEIEKLEEELTQLI